VTATINASPRAQELADELDVDLAEVEGSGKEGAITADDVREAAGVEASSSTSGWATKGYSGEQPWDDASELNHSQPVLVSGSAGPEVAELCTRLRHLGYESDYSRGDNPFSVLSPSVLAAVDAFRRDYGVAEDHRGYPGGEAQAAIMVGPWTWEAVIRASEAE
jgi:hypothetical protein